MIDLTIWGVTDGDYPDAQQVVVEVEGREPLEIMIAQDGERIIIDVAVAESSIVSMDVDAENVPHIQYIDAPAPLKCGECNCFAKGQCDRMEGVEHEFTGEDTCFFDGIIAERDRLNEKGVGE